MNDCDLEVFFGNMDTDKNYSSGFRPGLWGKYKKGSMCPKFKPDLHGRHSIVERVELSFPGTAGWIWLPFWDVLSSKEMNMSELKAIYLSLPSSVHKWIVMHEIVTPNVTKFWRRPIETRKLYLKLLGIGDIFAATAVLALIKEGEVTQNKELHLEGLKAWGIISKNLTTYSTLAPLLPDINAIVKDKFHNMCYPFENGRYKVLTTESMQNAFQATPT